jgi:Rrf2 family protein
MTRIRPAQASDLKAISALDARETGVAKPDYWREMLAPDRHFMVAESDKGALAGFIAGEIRAWEFGQPAAGWVFAIQIDPKLRLKGVGSELFEALVARFKAKGVTRVRTLVDRKDHLILSFFRAQGMVAVPIMKLQTATRLGLYAILELARDPERTLSSADLAERFGVSSHHLAKVMGTLSNAGLVRGGRGAGGGYRFTGNRRRVTLMDIVALFEPAPGSRAKEPGEDTDIGASLQRVLTEIDEIAEATLASITLETMLRPKSS